MVLARKEFLLHSREVGAAREVTIPDSDGVVVSGNPFTINGSLEVNGSLTETGGGIVVGDGGNLSVGPDGGVTVI